jgi:hypothetical protein
MSTGVTSGGTQQCVRFGSNTVHLIPASNTGRHVSPHATSRATSRAFSKAANQIPSTVLQLFMQHFDFLLAKTMDTVLPTLTALQASLPGFLAASFAQAYSLHLSQSPYPVFPIHLTPHLHRLEVSLQRKLTAQLASLSTRLPSWDTHPTTPPTPDTLPVTHLPHTEHTSNLHDSPTESGFLLPFMWLSSLDPLPPSYYRTISNSKSGKKWLVSLTYKIWHIPWVCCLELISQSIL